MNYARYAEWVRERVEDLVGFGVPREDAEAIMHYVEIGGISAESAARSDQQFLIEFREVGSEVMAERRGVSKQAICKQRSRILNRKPMVDRTVDRAA